VPCGPPTRRDRPRDRRQQRRRARRGRAADHRADRPRHRAARGQAFEAAIPAGHNAFAYVYAGAVDIGDAGAATRVEVERMALLGNDAEASGGPPAAPEGGAARVLLVAGGRSASRSRSTGRS
jgi:redox-sensitive bicupin YhaK (pirin superfamily)